MAGFGGSSPAEVLCDALQKRKKYVEFSSLRSINALVDEAYKLDPRLCGCVKGWKGSKQGSGLLGLNKAYSIEIEYTEDLVENIDDIILDNGSWKPSDALSSASNMPTVLQVVTQDINGLQQRINDEAHLLKEKYPGLQDVNYEWSSASVNGYSSMWIKFLFYIEPDRYKMYHTLATREMERIDRTFFGKGSIPKTIRVFLAFSYLQQTCKYDQESADLAEADQHHLMERPWALIPYGALVKHVAVCDGIAAAFKMFMDFYGIPCKIVFGSVDEGKVSHCWNMVCLNEKYYHVDATYGMEGDGIYIGAFLKTDVDMGETHFWRMADYPPCTSDRLDYDYVEDYINEHLDDLIAMGVEERYLCPEDVRE